MSNPAPSNLLPPQSPAAKKYSITWARSIVDRLAKEYPRVLPTVLDLYGLSLHQLALYLSKGDPVYAYLRSRVHCLAKYYGNGHNYLTPVEYLTWERGLLAHKSAGLQSERLDSRLKAIHNTRAGFDKGIPGGGTPADRDHPLPSDLPGQLLLFKGGYYA